MQKWCAILILSEIRFRGKSSFPKKVNVLKPHVLRSRMRVRDGSPKNKEIEKRGNSVKNVFKNSHAWSRTLC